MVLCGGPPDHLADTLSSVPERGLTTIRVMIDAIADAEVPGVGPGVEDDAEVPGVGLGADDGGAGLDDGRAGLGADDGGAGLDDGEELIDAQRARFARLLEKLEGEGFDGAKHLAELEARVATWAKAIEGSRSANEGSRSDLLLDGAAVSALAADRELLAAYLRVLEESLYGMLLIPSFIMIEAYTAPPDERALVDRLIEEISGKEDVLIALTNESAMRAGELRHKALVRSPREKGSRLNNLTNCAFVVSAAEELSDTHSVMIVTDNPDDINLLIEITGRTNIGVDLLV